MAKFKGYRTYFVGVEEFFFHDFFHKFCELIGIESKDYQLNKILFESSEFTESEFHILYRPGNLSNQLSGKITSVSAVKNYSTHEDMYYNLGSDLWVNLICSKLIDQDYAEEINIILNGIDSIIAKNKEIGCMQAQNLCQGYDSEVLQQLKSEILTVCDFMDTADEEYYKECVSRILLMTLTYFVANGKSFIHLGKEKPVADHIFNAYKEILPAVTDEIPDFDSELIANVSYNSEDVSLQDVIKKEPGNIIVTGDGGAGKSTMMLYAANNLLSAGKLCVFIDAKKNDDADTVKKHLILNTIFNVFPEWQTSKKDSDLYYNCHKILSDNIKANKLIVFIDALNEASPASQQSLADQISRLSDATGKLQFVISSRYNIQPLNHFKEVTVNTLNPLNLLSEDKAASFKMLSNTDKEAFSIPLFIKIIKDNDNIEFKTSILLSKKYQREIEKASQRHVVDHGVVTDFVCEFSYHLFRNCGRPLAFSLEQLKNYAENCYMVHNFEYLKNQLSYIFTLKDSYFFYNHETERDYLLARYITNQFENSDNTYETCIKLFCGVKYPPFVLKLLKEMLQNKKRDIFKSLRQKNCGDLFYSDDTAKATEIAIAVFQDNKQLRGLNLTKCHFGSLIKNVNFADSLMQPSTLIGNSINSAIFKICSDENYIYAIGRGRINVFDHDLCEKVSVDFLSDTNIICCRQNNSKIVFVDKNGRCFVFDKLTSSVKRLLADKVFSVETLDFFDQGGFLVGLDNGKFAVIDEEIFSVEIIQTNEPKYIVPVDKSDDNEYIYITASGDIHKFNADNHLSDTIWKSDCLQKDLPDSTALNGAGIKSALKLTEGCYVLEFYKPGFSLLCEVNIDTERWQIIHISSAGNAVEAEKNKSSYHIDYNKINDIVFSNGVLFTATNSGFVNVFIKNDIGNWALSSENRIDYTAYSRNPGDGVEAVCTVNKNTLLFSTTTRSIYQANYSVRNGDFNYALTNSVIGTNIGVRRIVMSKDKQKLYAFCFNHSVIVYIRGENDRFVFSEKIDTGSGWVWAGCEDDCGNLYIACDEKVFVYSDGKTKLLKSFDTKVENLFFVPAKDKQKAMLLAAVGYRIEQFVFADGNPMYTGKTTVGKGNDRYRPLSFAVCRNSDLRTEEIAVACSSYKNEDGSLEPASVFKLESSGSLRRFLKDDSLEGWFRSVEYDDKTGCYVCAGLKYGGDDAAIVFSHKEQMIYVLTGNRSYVSDAKVIRSEKGILCVAVTGYDGNVNLYSITLLENTTKPLFRKFIKVTPFKCFDTKGSTLFNIVADGNDLLIPSLDGRIYRLQNCIDEEQSSLVLETVNHNIFVTDSDLSKVNGVGQLADVLKAFNNKT